MTEANTDLQGPKKKKKKKNPRISCVKTRGSGINRE